MRFGIRFSLWSRAWSNANLDLIQHARDLGYSAFEIGLANLPQVDAKAIRQRAEASGIEIVSTISIPRDRALTAPDPAVRKQGIAFLKAVVERVRDMNCRLLAGMPYGSPGVFTGAGPTTDEMQRIAEALKETAEVAKAYDITLAIEPVNRYETYLLNTTAQAQALVDAIGEENVGLLLDTYHMNIEERGIADTLRRHSASLRYLHLNESDRGLLGGGNVDWRGVFNVLKEIRYTGIATIECFSFVSPDVPSITPIWRTLFPSADDLARDGLAFLSKGLGGL